MRFWSKLTNPGSAIRLGVEASLVRTTEGFSDTALNEAKAMSELQKIGDQGHGPLPKLEGVP